MACDTEIYSVAKTIKKFHIQSPLHFVYQKTFHHDKQRETDAPFDEYQIPLLKIIYHLALIKELRQNLDAAAYEKNQTKK